MVEEQVPVEAGAEAGTAEARVGPQVMREGNIKGHQGEKRYIGKG